ncbi:MAG: ABC transporter ATP-binding protein [Lachnospiraceae bacterium]|nr:ABC transporter ATP-binding protein [Lachnospiraceae bacterium]
MSILSTKNLNIGYDSIIVRDINIDISEGEIAVLIGPNGAGKTTLLKTVSGLISSVSGSIFLNDKDFSDISFSEKSRLIATVLTEKTGANYTCEEMISLGRYPYTNSFGSLSSEDKEIVNEAMMLTDTLDLADKSFLKISDGQKQRVLLARAICQRPKLLILDEPTSFLDVKYKLEFLKTLKELSRTLGFSVLMSLHELDMAKQISDKLICIKDDRIDKIGSADDIFKDGYIKDLFGIYSGDFDEKTGLGIIWHTN